MFLIKYITCNYLKPFFYKGGLSLKLFILFKTPTLIKNGGVCTIILEKINYYYTKCILQYSDTFLW